MKNTIADKSKSKTKTTPVVEQSSLRGKKSKILVLGLILIILVGVGFLGQAEKAEAAGACFDPNGNRITLVNLQTKEACLKANSKDRQAGFDACAAQTFPFTGTDGQTYTGILDCAKKFGVTYWDDSVAPTPTNPNPGTIPNSTTSGSGNSAFDKEVKEYGCGVFGSDTLLPGCLVQGAYYLLYVFPSLLLALAAYFFNILISVTVNSTFLDSDFITGAWGVVRDLSNIFFILILLYIAIQIILDMGGHDAKKMIAKVLIVALLINFSMFFTQVIIDSSNILALIFYNKLKTTSSHPSPLGDKDISGGLVSAFNPTRALSSDFFDEAKNNPIPLPDGTIPAPNKKIPMGMLFGIIATTGAIFLFATYALFMSGMFFLGRLIELFVLIIFSPFAFMSSTIPLLSGASYIGWNAWFKRLLTVSFMAPIFMFFLYFIFMLVEAKLYDDILKSGDGVIIALLRMIIPATLILILLLKATEYAKKGSGAFGEAVMKAGGIALGLAAGGVALAGSAGIGRVVGYAANKTAGGVNWLAKKDNLAGKIARGVGANKLASGLTGLGALAHRSSFDVRGIKVGGASLSSITGMNLGAAQKGGVEQRRKDKVEKRKKRAEMLKVRDDEKISKDIREAEMDLQQLLNQVAGDFHAIDEELKDLRQKKSDTTDLHEKQLITDKINTLNAAKKTIKTGGTVTLPPDVLGGKTVTGPRITSGTNKGATIKDLGSSNDGIIIKKQREKEAESRRRRTAFAKRTGRWYKGSADKQAKHQIIMETKIENKDAHK